jgi:hypothetical protein
MRHILLDDVRVRVLLPPSRHHSLCRVAHASCELTHSTGQTQTVLVVAACSGVRYTTRCTESLRCASCDRCFLKPGGTAPEAFDSVVEVETSPRCVITAETRIFVAGVGSRRQGATANSRQTGNNPECRLMSFQSRRWCDSLRL